MSVFDTLSEKALDESLEPNRVGRISPQAFVLICFTNYVILLFILT